eukprot:3525785-Pyramimonas_sp.AAC.1
MVGGGGRVRETRLNRQDPWVLTASPGHGTSAVVFLRAVGWSIKKQILQVGAHDEFEANIEICEQVVKNTQHDIKKMAAAFADLDAITAEEPRG